MYAMADPDPQLSGGRWGGRFGAVIQNLRWGDGLKNNFFRPFGPQFGLKTRGAEDPLDLPVCMYQKHLDFTSQLQYHCVSSTHHNMFLL